MTTGIEPSSPGAEPAGSAPGRFGRRFWPLFLLGLPGIATLPLVLVPMLREQPLPPGMPALSLPALVALSLVNPLLYLAAGAALGAGLAHRLALVSLVAERAEGRDPLWPRLRAAAPLAVGAGLAVALATTLLDATFRPYLGPEWERAAARAEGPGTAGALLSGLLYGGITEELMLRWGVLSLLAWLGWRLVQRGRGAARPGVLWGAIVVAALVFGVAHLPAVAALATLTPALAARTVALNALAGVVFGWLFWRRHLEAAMLAHAAAHVGFALLARAGWG